MNIFYLDPDPSIAAQCHVDKHVIKMPLEYAQLLSTAHALLDDNLVGYKPTHINHPSAKWARLNPAAYLWLFDLFECTSAEYAFRYGRVHKSWGELALKLHKAPLKFNSSITEDFVPPFKAMPADYIVFGDTLASYRKYYNEGKRDLHVWSRRDKPAWITPHEPA